MAALTKAGRKVVRHERYLKVVARDGATLTVEIHAEKRKPETYDICPADSDFGRAFEVKKHSTREAYHCCFTSDADYCDCIGSEAGYQCRHLACCEALIRAGRL